MEDNIMKLWEEELSVTFGAKQLTLGDFNAVSLSNEDADRFIDLVVDETALLKAIRVHRTSNPSGDLSKLNVVGPITERATENTDSGNTSEPVNTVVSFNTAKTRSAIDITGEVEEDTIEGGGVRTTIMNVMTKQIANDMEMLSIEGDDSVVGATATQRLLRTNDGFHILTAAGTGVHRVDAAGTRASYALLAEMLRSMPTKWRKNKADLRWIISANSAEDLADEYAGRLTDLGDRARTGGTLPPVKGIEFLVIPLLPEDLTIDGTSGSTGTFVWLANPRNFIYVVQRAMTIEWERVPRSDRNEGTVHMRTDFIIEETDAIVKAYNVNTDTGVAYYA